MPEPVLHRGATLPYKLLAGVEPSPKGWVVVTGRLQGITLLPQPPQLFERFIDILDHKPNFTVIAVHAPIGLLSEPAKGGRPCERDARRILGWPRLAAITPAPTRPAMEARTYKQARKANGGSLSTVTWGQRAHIREVDAAIEPYWQRTVYEVNPELTFHQLNNDTPLRFPKRSSVGVKERHDLLEQKFRDAAIALDRRLPGVDHSHVVDALADLWTARRIASKSARRLPEVPTWDDTGLRMEISY